MARVVITIDDIILNLAEGEEDIAISVDFQPEIDHDMETTHAQEIGIIMEELLEKVRKAVVTPQDFEIDIEFEMEEEDDEDEPGGLLH